MAVWESVHGAAALRSHPARRLARQIEDAARRDRMTEGAAYGFWDPSPASGKSGVAGRMLAAGRTNGERDHLGRRARRTRGTETKKGRALADTAFP
jgi:hypothetical protein